MSISGKLDRLLNRAAEIRHLLNTAGGSEIGALSKELSDLEPLVAKVTEFQDTQRARDEAEAMLGDPELRELAEPEYFTLRDRLPVPVINPGPLSYKLAEAALALRLGHSRKAHAKPAVPKLDMIDAMMAAAAAQRARE